MGGSFIDVQCQKCKRKYGWFGTMTDQPPCPKCQHVPDPEKLAEAEKEMEEMQRLILAKCYFADGPTLKAKRESSGLLIHHAAAKLLISTDKLKAIEEGREKVNVMLAAKMDRLYGGDE